MEPYSFVEDVIMLYKEFIEDVRKALYERMDNISVIEDDILKNNGLHYPSLLIKEDGEKLGVNFYPYCLFLQYARNEITISEIADKIIEAYKTEKRNFVWDVSILSDYEQIKYAIRGRLINTEKNKELLATLPHRDFLDLSIIYTLDVKPSKGHETGNIKITNDLMNSWQVEEEILYQQMMANMEILEEGTINSMASIMEEILGTDPMLVPSYFPMYVISNQNKMHGAIEILNKELLEKASTMLGGDFYIIPSSIHEWILLPSQGNEADTVHFRSMVQEVNDFHVANEEVLSYNLYLFRQETGEIEIAA